MGEDLVKWDHPVGIESRGSILLVHGTAPMNIDGDIPGCDSSYSLGCMSLYKELSKTLTNGGWSTLRYTRSGVNHESINWDEYMKVDHYAIIDQLNRLFKEMPSDKPRIIYCWSGGSLHIPHLPLDEAQGVVMVGGLCTNRIHNALLMAKGSDNWNDFYKEVEEFEGMTYEEILKANKPNGDGPLIRFWQEIKLKDNWTYLRKHVELPMLILHGSDDNEVPKVQAHLWKQLLPYHNITVVEKLGGNHFLGNDNETGAEIVGEEILKWLDNSQFRLNPTIFRDKINKTI